MLITKSAHRQKPNQKFKSENLFFCELKTLQGNQNIGGKHKKLPLKSNEIDP